MPTDETQMDEKDFCNLCFIRVHLWLTRVFSHAPGKKRWVAARAGYFKSNFSRFRSTVFNMRSRACHL